MFSRKKSKTVPDVKAAMTVDKDVVHRLKDTAHGDRLPVHGPKTQLDTAVPLRDNGPVLGGGANSVRRPKTRNRRISCLDLGPGDYEGWLYTKTLHKKSWNKFHNWCVLKSSDLYIYASKMDNQATSRISLPMFTVSEAGESKKKHAFKVYNAGTSFLFRADDDKEKHAWMNMLSLAAIQYIPDPVVSNGPASSNDYSDEEDCDTSSLGSYNSPYATKRRSRNPPQPPRLQKEIDANPVLSSVVTSIVEADLDLTGVDNESRRRSELRRSLAPYGGTGMENAIIFENRAKSKQIKEMERELADIEKLLTNVSPETLRAFSSRYPEYVQVTRQSPSDIQSPLSANISSDDKDFAIVHQAVQTRYNKRHSYMSATASSHSSRESSPLTPNRNRLAGTPITTDL